jgi:hypothetical protein
MILRAEFLDGIRRGTITLAFRRWRRPSVRAGGTLLTAVGKLHIGTITRVDLEEITPVDVQRAGYASATVLLAELSERSEGDIYRIELGPLAADPRVALRDAVPATESEWGQVQARLQRLDDRSPIGPWTQRTLAAISAHPGLRAGTLCAHVGQEQAPFKLNVRKLKALGLTESLEVGYRLSPRGQALLQFLGDSGR